MSPLQSPIHKLTEVVTSSSLPFRESLLDKALGTLVNPGGKPTDPAEGGAMMGCWGGT